jgi:regulatory protein
VPAEARAEGARGGRSGKNRGHRRQTAGGAGQAGRAGDSSEVDSEGGLGRAADGSPARAADADPEAIARTICLRLLTAAPRTRAQLADVLRRRGVPDDAATAVLARFAEVGLIDDAMFASAWVESRHYGRGLARRALAAELNQRGVDRSDIQAAVEKLSPETELATARALVGRRLASTTGQPAQVRIRRLAGMLARKGYPAGLAYRVVREALEQEGQDQATGFDDEAFEAEFADGEQG